MKEKKSNPSSRSATAQTASRNGTLLSRFAMHTIRSFLFMLCCLLPMQTVQALDFKSKQLKLVDASTNTVLLEHNADERMAPSSMSKLMTIYVLFEKLKQGGLKLDDTFSVSEKAWRMGGSKMFVQVGTQVKVEDLIRGIIVQSGNDACVVVAEGLGNTEEGFAKMLNEAGARIGLKGSHFTNSTGWPDPENYTSLEELKHYMTASDLEILSHRLITDFPEYYPYFSEPSFTYNGITQENRNLLLAKDLGVDGLKTGHTEGAGYGIALSAKQGDRRLILVVNGLSSMAERASEGDTILRYGFREFEVVNLLEPGKPLPENIPVWYGEKDDVPLTVSDSLRMSLPRGERDKLRIVMKTQSPVPAPVEAGSELGTLEIYRGETLLRQTKLVAAEGVQKAGFVKHFKTSLKHLIGST